MTNDRQALFRLYLLQFAQLQKLEGEPFIGWRFIKQWKQFCDCERSGSASFQDDCSHLLGSFVVVAYGSRRIIICRCTDDRRFSILINSRRSHNDIFTTNTARGSLQDAR
ncbi:MAG TPA: hypothetical protein VFZ34_30235, partial [Blastocatellia bacterium]|nr:hypothetical protein [Blastocatellia bacterium]